MGLSFLTPECSQYFLISYQEWWRWKEWLTYKCFFLLILTLYELNQPFFLCRVFTVKIIIFWPWNAGSTFGFPIELLENKKDWLFFTNIFGFNWTILYKPKEPFFLCRAFTLKIIVVDPATLAVLFNFLSGILEMKSVAVLNALLLLQYWHYTSPNNHSFSAEFL